MEFRVREKNGCSRDFLLDIFLALSESASPISEVALIRLADDFPLHSGNTTKK